MVGELGVLFVVTLRSCGVIVLVFALISLLDGDNTPQEFRLGNHNPRDRPTELVQMQHVGGEHLCLFLGNECWPIFENFPSGVLELVPEREIST